VPHPALIEAGIALKVGETKNQRRDGTEEIIPEFDFRRVAFHAFGHVCGSLIVDSGTKSPVEIQRCLRHTRRSSRMAAVAPDRGPREPDQIGWPPSQRFSAARRRRSGSRARAIAE
jgi:hypothetical protein